MPVVICGLALYFSSAVTLHLEIETGVVLISFCPGGEYEIARVFLQVAASGEHAHAV